MTMSPGRRPSPSRDRNGHNRQTARMTSPSKIRKRAMMAPSWPHIGAPRSGSRGAGEGATGTIASRYTSCVEPSPAARPSPPTHRDHAMKRILLLGAAIALAFGAGLATQSIVGAQQQPITSKTVMDDPLVGGIYEQMLMQEVSFQPGAGVPWHIHPDGHEIAYVLEGAIKLQVDGQPDRVLKPGEGLHMNANVVHRGQAEPSGAKLLIVRLKPKDKPVMTPVEHK